MQCNNNNCDKFVLDFAKSIENTHICIVQSEISENQHVSDLGVIWSMKTGQVLPEARLPESDSIKFGLIWI